MEINIVELKEAVEISFSYNQLMDNMSIDKNNASNKRHLERIIHLNNIDISHFFGKKRRNNSFDKYGDINKLKELVDKYDTYKEILNEIGLLAITSNYIRLKEYLIDYKIDISKFENKINNPNYKYENFKILIEESSSYNDLFKKLNLTSKGDNYRQVNRYIKKYNLDISHFKNEYKINKKKTFDELFVENSNYDRKLLKKRIINDKLMEYICCLCGQDENWNGAKMSLILDHINGVNNDNRLENLRFVCPNCNATLDTHCGKNNSKRNLKKLENKFLISDKVDFRKVDTKENKNRYYNRRKVKDRPSKEVLENDIKELGYRGTSKKYGVSDTAIKKWLKIFNY